MCERDSQTLTAIRQHLERQWRKRCRMPAGRPDAAAALDRLEREIGALRGAGQRWAERDAQRFGDTGNYQSYCLEVHMASGFLAARLALDHDVRLQEPDNNSDVDFVHRHSSGVPFHFEVVCVNEWAKTWTEEASEGGVTLFSACWDGAGEAFQIRRLQDKLRVKTVREGKPWKFPDSAAGGMNILVADVSNIWMGGDPDWWDLMLLAHGPRAVPPICRRPVVGIFEPANEIGIEAEAEFQANRFFRERVHAIVFLMDRSDWHSPLDPTYCGMLTQNPALVSSETEQLPLEVLRQGFDGWVASWLSEPEIVWSAGPSTQAGAANGFGGRSDP